MAAPIGPGDIVECINAVPAPGHPEILVLGQRYQVLKVHDYLPYLGTDAGWMDCGVDLVGVPGPAHDLAWGLHRFKPVGDSALDALLKTPARIREDA
jgi:hypothetical protein